MSIHKPNFNNTADVEGERLTFLR